METQNKKELVTIPRKYLERLFGFASESYYLDDAIEEDKRFKRVLKRVGLIEKSDVTSKYSHFRENKKKIKEFFKKNQGKDLFLKKYKNVYIGLIPPILAIIRVKLLGLVKRQGTPEYFFILESNGEKFRYEGSISCLLETVDLTYYTYSEKYKCYILNSELKQLEKVEEFLARKEKEIGDYNEIELALKDLDENVKLSKNKG